MRKIENKLTNMISGLNKTVFTRMAKPEQGEHGDEFRNAQRESQNAQSKPARPDWYQATHGSDS